MKPLPDDQLMLIIVGFAKREVRLGDVFRALGWSIERGTAAMNECIKRGWITLEDTKGVTH